MKSIFLIGLLTLANTIWAQTEKVDSCLESFVSPFLVLEAKYTPSGKERFNWVQTRQQQTLGALLQTYYATAQLRQLIQENPEKDHQVRAVFANKVAIPLGRDMLGLGNIAEGKVEVVVIYRAENSKVTFLIEKQEEVYQDFESYAFSRSTSKRFTPEFNQDLNSILESILTIHCQ